MGLHRNARLGLAGRRALVADVEAGCRAVRRRDAAASRRRPLASGGGAGRRRRSSSAASLRVSRIARRGRTAARGCCRPVEQARICAARRRARLGAAADRRRDRPCARDRLADAPAGRDLAAAAAAARAAAPLRVALPRRSAAHRHKRFVRFSRPGHAVTGDRHAPAPRADAGRLRMGALTRRRPLPLRLQRAPPRRESGNRDRLRRARPRRLRRARDRAKRLMSDNAWTYTHNRALAELLAAHAASATC